MIPEKTLFSLKCRRCGFTTQISWRKRRTKRRYCRNCGSIIAELKEPLKR